MQDNKDESMEWNSTIENDSEFIILDPGEYDFKIHSLERGRFDGSDKMSSCPMAKMSVRVDGGDKGFAFIAHRLFLHRKTESFVCEFFRSIGARQEGENYIMNWNQVQGATGRCKVGIREYYDTSKRETRQCMEIKKFLDPVVGEWIQEKAF